MLKRWLSPDFPFRGIKNTCTRLMEEEVNRLILQKKLKCLWSFDCYKDKNEIAMPVFNLGNRIKNTQ